MAVKTRHQRVWTYRPVSDSARSPGIRPGSGSGKRARRQLFPRPSSQVRLLPRDIPQTMYPATTTAWLWMARQSPLPARVTEIGTGKTWESTSPLRPPATSRTATACSSTSIAAAKKSIILGSGQGRRRHHRHGRESPDLRSGQAPRRFQCQLHHQLPCSGHQGHPRPPSASNTAS